MSKGELATVPEPVHRVHEVPYDTQSIGLIGQTLGVQVELADFRLPGGSVYQLMVPGDRGRPAVLLILWPSLSRIDAVGGAA
ncbi:MAG: hypothetical protein M3R06_08185, partial [Chloroflexota bacterium]|nr:hypothetical protein [Chloroflexota bacterium]